MKTPTLRGEAIGMLSALPLAFCQKEESSDKTFFKSEYSQRSGINDIPALLCALPIIIPINISCDSLNQSTFSSTLYEREIDIPKTPVNKTYPNPFYW